MLHELVVKNLGVIEAASIVIGPGLTALTGETGAGKTLLTEAIGLLRGGRADPMLVRPGADEAVVEGRFVTGDDEIIVRRVIPREGRSRSYLDDGLASTAALADTIVPLVEVHGQHGHGTVLRAASRRSALDRFGNHDTQPLADARAALAQARSELEALGGDEFARAREIELLRYQLDEIEQAGLSDADEDERLVRLESTLGDATAHREAAAASIDLLSADGPLAGSLTEAIGRLDDRAPFAAVLERLYALQAEAADLVDQLRDLADEIDDDPESLQEVQRRREQLTTLRRKYGPDLQAVIDFSAQASVRVTELENHDIKAQEIDERIRQLELEEAAQAKILGDLRRSTASTLAAAVEKDLRTLALPKARFEVVVGQDDGHDVDFAISTNPGAPLLPLAKVASGGELSRVMLALQFVVGSDAATVVYDEVDAGVGGEAATSIGRALAGVGAKHQVLVVTHLPQVAAFADDQINIAKSVKGSSTITELRHLDEQARIVELARMLSGSPDSDNARAHAAELLEAASA